MLQHTWSDRLPSVDAHVAFTAKFHVTVAGPHFAEMDGHGEPRWLWPILTDVQSRTEAVVKTTAVTRRTKAQHQVNEYWAGPLQRRDDETTSLVAVTVALSVDPDDQHAAEQLERARREEALDAEERRRIAATMDFLQRQCFHDPASARLFLMLNTNTRLGVFPTAEQAASIVSYLNDWRPDALWVRLAQILEPVLRRLTAAQADELLRFLQGILFAHGEKDAEREMQTLRMAQRDPAS